MPLLDIAIAHSSFQNYLGCVRVQHFVIGTIPHHCMSKHGGRWLSFRKSFQSAGNFNLNLTHLNKKSHNKFLVKAVVTLEPKCFIENEDGQKKNDGMLFTEEQTEDSEDISEREKLRRIRISKANKGNTPWNKGRKHSPETLQRIRERTKLAMQNPKVKMKLANIGHAQSQETRKKIAVGVRVGWQKRREKLLLQETCLFDWQNLIAEAARHGFLDEEELQWDSYEIMNERLREEWLASIEYRKATPRPKGSKRAPKSLEQRRKIAEAIAAKWADPEYRSRVSTGLAKYHGIPEGAERRVRKKPLDGSQQPRTPKKRVTSAEKPAPELKVKAQQPKLKKRTTPKYKDPLVNTKLEMLKSIRAQRVAMEAKKNISLERAKLLIAEAEKAAKALEIAALRSPVAHASLIEARKLIVEATRSIELIENKEATSEDEPTLGKQNHAETDESPIKDLVDEGHHSGVNGTHNGHVHKSNNQNREVSFYKTAMQEDLGVNHHLPNQISGYEFPKLDFRSFIGKSEQRGLIDQEYPLEVNRATKLNGLSNHHLTKLQIHEEEQLSDPPLITMTKKWVRGRLVEVLEGQ